MPKTFRWLLLQDPLLPVSLRPLPPLPPPRNPLPLYHHSSTDPTLPGGPPNPPRPLTCHPRRRRQGAGFCLWLTARGGTSIRWTHGRVGVNKPNPLLISRFSPLSKYWLPMEYHIYIWQVYPQPISNDPRQIWVIAGIYRSHLHDRIFPICGN